ncbi:MAG: HypC/HybG/HupF family hydrogenase formation chaperone [Firmicutes bacterium]|nr:HypC/HybG/HupF family hydrogenase formation chaperone [Bacillota bacterium]
MCLGIPGKIVEILSEQGLRLGRVDFGGVTKKVCLEYVPGLQVGDYTIVHAGFAISRVDEAEASRVYTYLAEMGELERGDEAR